jgi:hypothetical protein
MVSIHVVEYHYVGLPLLLHVYYTMCITLSVVTHGARHL